jgi:hypothetical protein
MLAGTLAAAIPVALHLLNRIRSPVVAFPTLRFLRITAEKTSRRRQVQQYLLLLVRMAVFAMIAMAISRPLIRGGQAGMAYGFLLMMLVGAGLAVVGAVWMGSASKKSTLTDATAGAEHARHGSGYPPVAPVAPGSPPTATARRGSFSLPATCFLLLGLLLAGWSAYGLASDRYFSGDRGEFTGRSTAAVMVLDNSHSMLAREDAATRFTQAKEQVRQVLADTVRPAEAAVLLTNLGAGGEERLTSDTTRLLGFVDGVEAAGRARPMKERIRFAVQMLERSQQANRMLIVVSDFARRGFEDAEVFAALKETPGGKDMQVVLMPMGKGSPPADVGIERFGVADGSGAPVVGSEIVFEAEVVNNGDGAEVKELALLVDDVAVEMGGVRPRVQLGPAGAGMVKIPYRLTKAGSQKFSLQVADANDAAAWNDRRDLVLDVEQQVKVLVVGSEEGRPRARSAAYYMMAALEPFSARRAEGTAMWSIAPTYRGVGQVKDYGSLAGYSAVFMCDVPRVPAGLADGLARYVKESGRIVWVLGPSVDGAAYNRELLGGRNLLPGALGQPVIAPAGSVIDWVDLQSPLFANLFDNQEPFRGVVVTGRWGLAGGGGRALAKLADGSVVLMQHAEGGGIYTLLTSPGAGWSNLGATVLLVPLASRMALGDSGNMRLETSYEPGANLLIKVKGADRAMAAVALDVTTPAKAVHHTAAVMSGDVPRWYFEKTLAEGVYRWRSADGKHAGMFAVNPPGEEVELQAADVEQLGREVRTNRGAIVARSAPELLAMLEKRSEGTSLTPGVIGMVMMLAVAEGLVANRRKG